MGIRFNIPTQDPPPFLLLFTIFKRMCLTTFYVDSEPTLKTVKLMVSKVIMLHENTELLISSDYYKLSLGNNYLTQGITLILVEISNINQLK